MKKQNNNKEMKNLQVPGDWLYFVSKEIRVRDIYESIGAIYEMEIWEDAGVLEINMAEGSSLDIEEASIHPKDELTAAFAKEHGCAYVFLVTFKPEEYEAARSVMETIKEHLGGFFCGDTENFQPVLM